jgi:hypothetical protein
VSSSQGKSQRFQFPGDATQAGARCRGLPVPHSCALPGGRGRITSTADSSGPLQRKRHRYLRLAGGGARERRRDRRSFAISGNSEPDLQLPPGFFSKTDRRWQQAHYKSQSPHFLAPNARSTVRICNSGVLGWDGSAFHSTCCRGLAKEQQKRGRPGLRVDARFFCPRSAFFYRFIPKTGAGPISVDQFLRRLLTG